MVRRNIFNWKKEGGHSCPPSFETKVKDFCAIPQVLAFINDYII